MASSRETRSVSAETRRGVRVALSLAAALLRRSLVSRRMTFFPVFVVLRVGFLVRTSGFLRARYNRRVRCSERERPTAPD
jgi:hypothetical protein